MSPFILAVLVCSGLSSGDGCARDTNAISGSSVYGSMSVSQPLAALALYAAGKGATKCKRRASDVSADCARTSTCPYPYDTFHGVHLHCECAMRYKAIVHLEATATIGSCEMLSRTKKAGFDNGIVPPLSPREWNAANATRS